MKIDACASTNGYPPGFRVELLDDSYECTGVFGTVLEQVSLDDEHFWKNSNYRPVEGFYRLRLDDGSSEIWNWSVFCIAPELLVVN